MLVSFYQLLDLLSAQRFTLADYFAVDDQAGREHDPLRDHILYVRDFNDLRRLVRFLQCLFDVFSQGIAFWTTRPEYFNFFILIFHYFIHAPNNIPATVEKATTKPTNTAVFLNPMIL